MHEDDWLVRQFDESRAHLRAVAYRMLGSSSEAEDAIQETWLKLSRSDTHAGFNLSFDEIARIVNRTPAAARQLASRARRRVRGAETPTADLARHREVVSAFLAASRDGDFERLIALLSADAVSALIDGEAGAVWAVAGQVRSGFVFRFEGGDINTIKLIMGPEHLSELDVKIG
jgi:hypothetical protein